MNRQLILDDFIEIFASKAGIKRERAESFVKGFFAELASALADEGKVTVDALGSFAVNDNGEIAFVATSSMADEINAPFALFEPVELAVNVSADSLDGTQPEQTSTAPAEEPKDESPTDKPEPPEPLQPEETENPAPTEEQTPSNIEIPSVPTDPEPQIITPPPYNPQPRQQTEEQSPIPYYETPMTERAGGGIMKRLVCILLVAALVVGAYIAGLYTPEIKAWLHRITAPTECPDTPQTIIIESSPAVSCETEPEPKAEAEVPKEHLDTVRVKYYITHMAKRYYGDDCFWSYIYKENEASLGNPDYTQIGTVVVIPPAEKYDIDANNPESVAAAKQLGYEIYQPYVNGSKTDSKKESKKESKKKRKKK